MAPATLGMPSKEPASLLRAGLAGRAGRPPGVTPQRERAATGHAGFATEELRSLRGSGSFRGSPAPRGFPPKAVLSSGAPVATARLSRRRSGPASHDRSRVRDDAPVYRSGRPGSPRGLAIVRSVARSAGYGTAASCHGSGGRPRNLRRCPARAGVAPDLLPLAGPVRGSSRTRCAACNRRSAVRQALSRRGQDGSTVEATSRAAPRPAAIPLEPRPDGCRSRAEFAMLARPRQTRALGRPPPETPDRWAAFDGSARDTIAGARGSTARLRFPRPRCTP